MNSWNLGFMGWIAKVDDIILGVNCRQSYRSWCLPRIRQPYMLPIVYDNVGFRECRLNFGMSERSDVPPFLYPLKRRVPVFHGLELME